MSSASIMTTDKISIQHLVELCYQKGLRQVVFSPGSRNAPLVIGFSEHGGFECRTIADERVAAFFAMGQGIASGRASIICCTSGTAALNYAPAIAEAYNQQVPLLVITADRPPEWIDMGIGQCMKQENVYANYIKKSCNLKCDPTHKDEIWYNHRLINEALNTIQDGHPGPVHINTPFREPLYTKSPIKFPHATSAYKLYPIAQPSTQDAEQLKAEWASHNRKIVIAGMLDPNPSLKQSLEKLVDESQIILLTETTSNLNIKGAINSIDRVLWALDHNEDYSPDLILSIGGPIVSKKIINFLNDHQPRNHWALSLGIAKDSYQSMTRHLPIDPIVLFETLEHSASPNDEAFQKKWDTAKQKASIKHEAYLKTIGFSDLWVFQYLMANLTSHSTIHLANSTPVRYSQLFPDREDLIYHSNRGVSGIDGSTSTAIGYASVDKSQNIFITGDVSFFYDSNAFWINRRPSNLKVILINNGGGGIFRYIPGPDTTDQLASVFESEHQLNAKPLCQLYDLEYFSAANIVELQAAFQLFIASEKDTIQVLEIKTPRLLNAQVLREYFKFFKG